jgi:type II secretory pathway component GspD/PulD (secretin)
MRIPKISKLPVLVMILALVLCGAATGRAAINTGAPVTANFQNTDIREALQTLAAAGQAKITVNTSVTAKVMARFANIPFNEALQSLLSQAGLESRSVAIRSMWPCRGSCPSCRLQHRLIRLIR